MTRIPTTTTGITLAMLLCMDAIAAPPNFSDDILPLFKKHCLGCHNADDKKSDLDLSTFKAVEAGSSGGKVVKPGAPNTSPLYLAVNHAENSPAMPPEKPKLPDNDLRLIHDWIAGGLIAVAGGKSQLRDVAFDVRMGSLKRPEQPAFPAALHKQPPAKTLVAPPVIALASSPWTNVIATSGHRQVLLYGATTPNAAPQYLGNLPFPEGDVHDLRFSRNGDLLIAAGGTGADTGKVAIFDVRSGRRVATLADEYDVILSADISVDHKYLAIGTPSKLVKIFSTQDGQLLHRIKKHTDWVTTVRFSPDGLKLATGDRNGGIHIWETNSCGIIYTFDEHKVKVTALSWRADSKVLVSAAEDGKFVLWDLKDGWATRTVTAHAAKAHSRYSRRTGVLDIAFARDGRILTTGRDRSLRLWKTDGTPLGRVNELPSLPLRVQFSADEKTALLGSMNGSLQIWDLTSMKRTANVPSPMQNGDDGP